MSPADPAPKPASKPMDAEATQAITRALADPTRYTILRLLAQWKPGSQCSALREGFEIAPPTFSHHMQELRTVGLVEECRTGRTVAYTLRRDAMEAYLAVLRRDLLVPEE